MSYQVSISESIADILNTRRGERVMLPSYGSDLHKLIDRRVDDSFIADATIYVVEALKSEPRAEVESVKVNNNSGSVTLDITTNVGTFTQEIT